MSATCIWSCMFLALVAAVYGQSTGCTTPEGRRVEPYGEHRNENFLFRCQNYGQSYALVPVACIRNGQVINLGASTHDQNFWYTCEQRGEQIAIKTTHCVGEHGSRVGPHGIVQQGNFLFRCTYQNDRMGMEPYGCVVDGQQYPAGQQIIKGNFWYECNILPSGLEFKIGGCYSNGQRIHAGQTVVQNGFVYRCDMLGNQVSFQVVGCVDDMGGQRMIGDRWRDGAGPLLTTWECQRQGDRITKKPVPICYYRGHDGEGQMDPNCVRRFGTTMIKCIPRGPDQVAAEMYQNANDQTFRNAINAGFRQC